MFLLFVYATHTKLHNEVGLEQGWEPAARVNI